MKLPKFVIQKHIVLRQYNSLKHLADLISYSSKTNPIITTILETETDSLFSIHSEHELKHIKNKTRIIFLAQGWTEEQITRLIEQKINYFVVDNEPDLNNLIEYITKSNQKIKLMLRLKLKENSIRTERHFVFGFTKDAIARLIPELKNNKNITELGIHFHRKTQNVSEWNLKYELENTLENNVLNNIDIINIGGGLPSYYANTNIDVIHLIINKITELKSWLSEKNIQLMIEPGRFIAAPSVELHTEIIGIYDNNIIVNASVYNSDLDALIVPVKLRVKGELSKGTPYVIKGITPCSMDLFRYRVYLDNPKICDKIIFLNAGAYNFHSEFCDLEKIETEIID